MGVEYGFLMRLRLVPVYRYIGTNGVVLCFQFQEAEKKRYRAEQQRFETKHQRVLEEARASAQSATKELEQLQNEKRKMLMEHETLKLKELDEAYAHEMREWKAQLKPRKQVRIFTIYAGSGQFLDH
jgi:G:T/U-mismatch repair DNA glycosylase